MFRWRGLLVSVAILTLAIAAPTPASRPASRALPAVMLWAWERPEDLRALGPGTGIAFLAQTITIDAAGVRVDPRRQSLKVTDDAVLVAVTRVEFPVTRPVTPEDLDRVADEIAATARFPKVAGVQIDFDALQSQRGFYRDLIAEVRARLGAGTPLSITALASWCAGDPWLDGLPIDEAVPMLFELGPLNEPYRALARSRTATQPICRGAIGIALNEPLTFDPRGRRVFVFSHRGWSPDAIVAALHSAEGQGGRP